MSEHVSYLLVLLPAMVIGFMNDFRRCQKDWYGISFIPGLLIGRLPGVILPTLVYLHFIHVFPILKEFTGDTIERYSVILYAIAAIISENLGKRLLSHSERNDKLPLTLGRKITRIKVKIADHLPTVPDAKEILEDAIRTSDELNISKRRSWIRALSDPPTRSQVLGIIEIVGLAHLRDVILAHA